MTAAWKTVRVFISSTFCDMQAERDHLVRFVFPKLRQELLQQRIHLVDVDLRWGVTSEQDALSVCREVVDECRPWFLCMLGGRYGWVPPGKTRSITADEVHYGVLDRDLRSRGFAYFYFRDPATTTAMVEVVPGEFREPAGSKNDTALTKLKSAIVEAGLPTFTYQAQWDGQSRRLIGLKEFGDRVYADLKQSIDKEFGTTTVEKSVEFTEENAAMEAFIEERVQRFFLGSRESVLNELFAHANSTGGNNYVCLTGVSGSGKSALLACFYNRLLAENQEQKTEDQPLVIPHFVGASPGSTDVRRTLRRLCHELKAGSPGIISDIPDDIEKLSVSFPSFLQQASVNNRVVIIIDAIDQFDPSYQSATMCWLPNELHPNVRVILSSLPCPSLEALRKRRHSPAEILLPALVESDVKAIIDGFLTRYRKTLDSNQRKLLLAKTDAGTPLYILTALEELRTLGTYEEMTSRIEELPCQIQPLFIWILMRLENDPGFRDVAGCLVGADIVRKLVSYIGVSRHGLSFIEIAELIAPANPKANPPIPVDFQGNVAALIRLLRSYLMPRGELLDFYHRQFKITVINQYLNTPEKNNEARQAIIDYFMARRRMNTRKINELSWQLLQAEQWRVLVNLLTNPLYFIFAWDTNPLELKMYWSAIEARASIRIEDAYRRIIESPPPMVEYISRLSEFLLQAGRFPQALALKDYLLNLSTQRNRRRGLPEGWAAPESTDWDRLEQAMALGNKATALVGVGKVEEAIPLFQQEQKVFRDLNNRECLARSLANQAWALKQLRRLAEAGQMLKDAEDMFRDLNMHLDLGKCLITRIRDLKGQIDNRQLLEMCLEAEKAFLASGDRGLLRDCFVEHGRLLESLGDNEGALTLYSEQEQVCRETDDLPGLVEFLGLKSQLLTYLDRMDEARVALDQMRKFKCRFAV